MGWREDPGDEDTTRVLFATVGPWTLAVVEPREGAPRWSVGAGEAGELGMLEGPSSSVDEAKRAAIAEARRRLAHAGEAIDALERARG